MKSGFFTWWIFLLLALPSILHAQTTRPDSVSSPLPSDTIASKQIRLVDTSDAKMDAVFQARDTSFFITITGAGRGANTVVINDKLLFLLDNDSTITMVSDSIQGFAEQDSIRTYRHQYGLTQEALEMLRRRAIQAIRKYTVLGYEDYQVTASATESAKREASAFWDALMRQHLIRTTFQAPAFPGGQETMRSFINNNLRVLPGIDSGAVKKMLVQFDVDAEGVVSNLQVKQSAGVLFDNEILRILKRMPRWKPPRDNGNLVKAVVSQEIVFYQDGRTVGVKFD